jgi:hypothetical protein
VEKDVSMKVRGFAAWLLLASAVIVQAQTVTDWQADVEAMLHEFMTCQTPIDDASPCNRFVGRALKRVYGIDDFNAGNGDFMNANQISVTVKTSGKWTKLGDASTQNALNEAQGYANLKKAIIAVSTGSPHGHVAIILPGSLTKSEHWGLNVPNSAAFRMDKPKESYIGKPLSLSWRLPKGVEIYGRNY